MSNSFAALTAALASRCAIERELGAGDMATVYLAEDLKHERKVAVKVLRPELAAVLGAERFLQEIRVTANLQHPHILPLHDSGRVAEVQSGRGQELLYYVMPYVQGESLRDRLNREKQLPIEDALAIATEVADALGSAHRQGVVHRDVKPENILLGEGHALVADFGIALAVKSAGGVRLTETGLSLGTPAYMSPEQIAGDRELDGRSDIYSLACVLYEMLAGEPPFTGPNAQAIVARHMTDPVPPITTVRSSVPRPVAAAITKALGKAPVDRFETTKAFSEALSGEAAEAEREVKSIVVLPFENLSPDPENAFFADGLTEEIITDLSKLRALRVISRNSAMVLKGTAKDTRTIGRELSVQYVLRGSVRKAADRLRITVQLIDAENDSHLWAERYDGVLDDVFDMQEQVSRSIADTLRLKLTPEEAHQLSARPIQDVQAYQWYLRARQETWLSTPDAVVRAEQYLKKGLEIIGEDALLDAGLAYVYWWFVNIGAEHDTHIELAAEYANKALILDPVSAEAHLVLGLLNQGIYGDQKQSFIHFAKALEIRPDDAHTLFWYAVGHVVVGNVADARPLLDRLLAVDPLTPVSMWARVCADVFDGAFQQPLEALTG